MKKIMKSIISLILAFCTVFGVVAVMNPATVVSAAETDGIMIFSKKKDGNTYLSKNFQVKEFACKDGTDTILIDPELVVILQKIRDHFGKPITINSAYRTPKHNAKEKGKPGSKHLTGQAADIEVQGVSPAQVAKYAEEIGVRGIGLYDGFVHVDTRDKKFYWYSSAIKKRTTFGGSFNSKPYKEASLVNVTCLTSSPAAKGQGAALKLEGTIVATSILKSSSCLIINAKGTVVQRASIPVNGKYAKVNLSFSNLPSGKYTIRITTDNGSLCTKWDKDFSVTEVANNSSPVKITCNLPSSIKAKKSCNLTGTISSQSGKITSVKAYILDVNGKAVQTVSYVPYAATHINIKNCKINSNLKFGKLSVGTYTLKIVATDSKGNEGTWIQHFSVK